MVFPPLKQILTMKTKLREIELKVQREINEKRQELLAKEESLRYLNASMPSSNWPLNELCNFRNLESRLAAQGSQADF